MDSKQCSKCKETRSVSDFHLKNNKPRSQCKACQAVYLKEHYRKNKAKYVASAIRSRKKFAPEKRAFIEKEKSKPCMDCGKSYPPYVMDFDHRDPAKKDFQISRGSHASWSKLKAEIAKCDVVCSNCHRERTYQQIQEKKRPGADSNR